MMGGVKESLAAGLALNDATGSAILYRYLKPEDSIDEITDMLHEA